MSDCPRCHTEGTWHEDEDGWTCSACGHHTWTKVTTSLALDTKCAGEVGGCTSSVHIGEPGGKPVVARGERRLQVEQMILDGGENVAIADELHITSSYVQKLRAGLAAVS